MLQILKIIKQTSFDSDCTGWASTSGTGVYAAQMEELIIENQHVTFKIHWNSCWFYSNEEVEIYVCMCGCECGSPIFSAAEVLISC